MLEEVKTKMQERGITQSDLARELGFSPMMISYFLRGKRFSWRLRLRISQALGIPLERLIKEPDKNN